MNKTNDFTMAARARRKLRYFISMAAVNCIGHWLNKFELPWMLEYRPDFHVNKGDIHSFDKLSKAWIAGNVVNNGGDYARFYMLYQNIRMVLSDGVGGDFVELGVYKGNSAFVLAEFAREEGRTAFLFDTFEGFNSRDFVNEDEGNSEHHFSDTSLDAVRRLVGEANIKYVQGYFPESLSQIPPIKSIAIAHIDCDLYEPMRAALEAFYPLLSPGGAIIMHDYASGEWPGATRAVDEFFTGKPERPIIIPDKSGTAIIRRTFA